MERCVECASDHLDDHVTVAILLLQGKYCKKHLSGIALLDPTVARATLLCMEWYVARLPCMIMLTEYRMELQNAVNSIRRNSFFYSLQVQVAFPSPALLALGHGRSKDLVMVECLCIQFIFLSRP